MSISKAAIRIFAKRERNRIDKNALAADKIQEKRLHQLIQSAKNTDFGRDHGFDSIKSYDDFKKAVAPMDYEGLRPYIDRIRSGAENVLWKGRPLYFAKTSGTTSGIKYIPISKEAIDHHVRSARNALFYYGDKNNDLSFLDGKMIFLSGSPQLQKESGINIGRLSGIVNHQVPSWLRRNQMPTYQTNCIEDWEDKLDLIVQETLAENMTLISGIPPWVKMYYERLLEATGKSSIMDIFPNLNMFVYGGVNFDPYRKSLETLVGKRLPSVETYPASEGFIAFQVDQDDPSLQLVMDNGIFYEFVKKEEFGINAASRYRLCEIELNVDYVLLLSSNSGLWSYNLGDIVRFTSRLPYKLLVVGRVKHFISAFGEHVIAKEVEQAIHMAIDKHSLMIVDFTVAPLVAEQSGGDSYHEWIIEAENVVDLDRKELSQTLDQAMIDQNIYYRDLRLGNILQQAKVSLVKKGAFSDYMKSKGKLGGQNKLPRLSNDREIADALQSFVIL